LFHNPPLLLDTVTYPDNPIPLMATADTSYMWVPSSGLNCTTCQNPIATVSQSTTYLVTRTDSFDCPSKEKFRVLIRTCDTIQSDTVLTKLDTTLYRSAEITLHASTSY